MVKSQQPSLTDFFRRQAIHWSLAGFGLTLVFAIPCVLYSAKIASERQVLTFAKSTARAFRPMILQGYFRDAQFQIRKALELTEKESAIVLDPAFSAFYPIAEADKKNHCSTPNHYCWAKGFHSVTLLYPIYFDDHSQYLFGYLEMTLKPTLDFSIISILIFLLFAAFIGQAYGLSSALSHSARLLAAQFSNWAAQLKIIPKVQEASLASNVPYSELAPMQQAISELHSEIECLRRTIAMDAKDAAQTSILRQIGHDLKTPLSQLSKYWALHLDTVRSHGKIEEDEVAGVERAMRRMGGIIRQVRAIHQIQHETALDIQPFDLAEETRQILFDLSLDAEVMQKKAKINFLLETPADAALVSQVGYYQILENLIRNAIHAIPSENGMISVSLLQSNGQPMLIIRDNGTGIPIEARSQIFDFDFTTKKTRGTGLGLGIVKRLCEIFEAEISFKSVLGVGTTFFVRFQTLPMNHEVNRYETQNITC